MGELIEAASFRRALLSWYDAAHRDLPWRQSADLYRVWISEIMLQQTRVEAVIPYYEHFLARFPDVQALAAAPEQNVLAAWSGLGYYSRARNLQAAAKTIAADGFPQAHAEILKLPGIGSYTAAAIASIALGQPYAAVDGNAIRVISRLTNDAVEVSSPAARRSFTETAQALLHPGRPGDFNQAMMELGATLCVPRLPRCGQCPVMPFCAAHAAGTERELPVKIGKAKARDVKLDLILFECEGRIFLMQRDSGQRRLANFWELPEKKIFPGLRARLRHEFPHRIVNDRYRVKVWAAQPPAQLPEGAWFGIDTLNSIPVATISRKAIGGSRLQ